MKREGNRERETGAAKDWKSKIADTNQLSHKLQAHVDTCQINKFKKKTVRGMRFLPSSFSFKKQYYFLRYSDLHFLHPYTFTTLHYSFHGVDLSFHKLFSPSRGGVFCFTLQYHTYFSHCLHLKLLLITQNSEHLRSGDIPQCENEPGGTEENDSERYAQTLQARWLVPVK